MLILRCLIDRDGPAISKNKMKGPASKIMPVNSIAQMMKPAHLRTPSKSPIALELIQRETALKPKRIPELKPRNGVGHYVLPLQRLLITYCQHCNDSRTTREYLEKHLDRFVNANPSVEVLVEPRLNKRPTIFAHYLEGKTSYISVANKHVKEIGQVVETLRNKSGSKARPFHQGVTSDTPAVRPIWSPFHAVPTGKADPLDGYRAK